MTWELSDLILANGKNAALRKMTQNKNLPKPDMRISTFTELQILLEKEVQELKDEIIKSFDKPLTP